jgi:hypothetical protein
MKLPSKVQIGCVGYTVRLLDDLHKVNEDGQKVWLHGHILHADAEIRVANDQSDDVKLVTLWHECLHGILQNAGQHEQPEPLIEALSAGLVQLIRDNPKVVKVTRKRGERER